MTDFAKYIVYISCKDAEGVVSDHPLCGFETELEAKLYLDGYVDAIVNHTDKEEDIEMIRGQFRISEIGKEITSD